jgi:hypothetical protein
MTEQTSMHEAVESFRRAVFEADGARISHTRILLGLRAAEPHLRRGWEESALTDEALDAAMLEWPAAHVPHLVHPRATREEILDAQEANRDVVRDIIRAALEASQGKACEEIGDAAGHDFKVPAPPLARVLAHFEAEANAADELVRNGPGGTCSRYEVPWDRRYEIERDTYRYVLEQIRSADCNNPSEAPVGEEES